MPLHLRVGSAPASGVAFGAEGDQGRRRGHSIDAIGRPPRTPAACRRTGGATMPTEAKRETVAELREELANARTMIVSEYRGLKVKEIAEIRRALRKQDVTYRVVKNRLMRIAAEDSVGAALSPLLIGPTAIAFGTDEAGTAKAVLDATRPYSPGRPDHRRRPRRPGDRRRRRHAARGAAAARGPAGQAGRRDAGAGGHARRPVRRPAAQPGLCPAAGRRAEGPRRTP